MVNQTQQDVLYYVQKYWKERYGHAHNHLIKHEIYLNYQRCMHIYKHVCVSETCKYIMIWVNINE